MDAAPLPDSGLRELLLWILRRRKRVGIRGVSMLPGLQPGDEILIDLDAYGRQTPRAGDIVLAQRPDRADVTMVKRVQSVEADGRLFLVGDNPATSTDSRLFGPVPLEKVLGRATSKFA